MIMELGRVSSQDVFTHGVLWKQESNLTEIPDNIPHKARGVCLHNNRIEVIRSNVFSNLPHCSIIDLSHNSIAEIETGAFNGLLNLNALGLFHNALTVLTRSMFQGLGTLDNLQLCCNGKPERTILVQ